MSAFEAIGRATSEVGVFHATDYGAVFDGLLGTDNTDAINDALTAAANFYPGGTGVVRGGVVQLPPGYGRITDTLLVKYGVWLRGSGSGATSLVCDDWTANGNPAIQLDNTNSGAIVSDLSLVFLTTSLSTAHGIQVDSGVQWGGLFGGINTEIRDVLVGGAGGSGVYLAGVENRLHNVYSARNARRGFDVEGTDMLISNCTADTNYYDGFLVNTSNSKFSNCKAFGGGDHGNEPAWNIPGTRNMLSSCEAQDYYGSGFLDNGGDNVFAGCVADTCGKGGGTSYGFFIGGSTATACDAINRSGSSQDYGYWVSTGPTGNPGTLVGTSRLPGVAHVKPESIGSIVVNNLIGTQTVSYSSPLTPDPYLGGTVIVGTLTGDLTVNLPSSGLFAGLRLGFQFVQDGSGGHSVTFNSSYKTSAALPTTANHVIRIVFEYDGSNFREITRSDMAS